MSEIGGVDFAWTKPSPQAVKAAGFTFVVGYSSGDPSKDLTKSLLAGYRAAGLRVGLVRETTANRVLDGAAAGDADGKAAEAQANAIGYPTTAPIFFAVDFDAQPAQYAAIAAYAAAFNKATRRPVGIYGSYDVIEHFVTPGHQPIQYGWQTAAWSHGLLSAKAHLYQRNKFSGHYKPIAGVPSNSYDEDVLCHDLPLAG